MHFRIRYKLLRCIDIPCGITLSRTKLMPQPCHNWIGTYYHVLGQTTKNAWRISTNYCRIVPGCTGISEFESLLLRLEKVREFQGFLGFLLYLYPLSHPFQNLQRFDKAQHPVRSIVLHCFCRMAIFVYLPWFFMAKLINNLSREDKAPAAAPSPSE